MKHLETIIAKNQYRFYEIGQALLEIRDSRLYKQALFTSFETYARSRWDIGRSQVYRLIDAYSVINNLSPIGDRLPGNEAQTRPLVPLSPPEQREIWKAFLNTKVEVTARNIQNFINERKTKEDTATPDLVDRISDEYMAAVEEMLVQVKYALNDKWQQTSRQAALLWHRVIQEKIICRESGHEANT
ncbi:DNA methylase [Candidatus Electrothrix sp.]|uniref:DNA methylase n=1 Tax=Candidatus Electrothrix sp. TaxID=2170559 RepID=UPI0040566142